MNGNNEAEAKIRKFWEWTPAVKHGTPAFTIGKFSKNSSILFSGNTNNGLNNIIFILISAENCL